MVATATVRLTKNSLATTNKNPLETLPARPLHLFAFKGMRLPADSLVKLLDICLQEQINNSYL